MRRLLLIPRFLGVWMILMVSYMAAAFLSGLNEPVPAPAAHAEVAANAVDPGKLLGTLTLVCFLIALVITMLLARSRGAGGKLIAALALAMFGVMTAITQIETWIFLRQRMPPGLMGKIWAMGAIATALFVPAAAFLLGKTSTASATEESPGAQMDSGRVGGLAWRLAVIGLIYVVLYMVFGYFVAWKNPVLREYYGGTDPGSFWAQMKSIFESTPWMFPFQIARAVLWALLVLPLIRVMRRPPVETALLMALFCSVWSSLLLIPNALMPQAVAHSHMVETFWSNLLFGGVIGFVLTCPFAREGTQRR